ncbi:MAG: hypothetical protein ACLGGZ_00465, partial [Alphaproteobacteria bacterium]
VRAAPVPWTRRWMIWKPQIPARRAGPDKLSGMRLKIIITPLAEANLREVHRHIARDNSGAA